MNQNKKLSRKEIVILGLFVAIALLIVACRNLLKDAWNEARRPYESYESDEWFPVDSYEAKPGKRLGQVPDGEGPWGTIYNLKGIPENELLIIDEITVFGATGLQIYMNLEVGEPIERIPIKKIEITLPDKSIVTITDKDLCNKIQQKFQAGKGDKVSFYYTTSNAKIFFDVECDLTCTCGIFKRDDGAIILAYWEYPDIDTCYYDVTELLKDKF